jgi:hypothetical protein
MNSVYQQDRPAHLCEQEAVVQGGAVTNASLCRRGGAAALISLSVLAGSAAAPAGAAPPLRIPQIRPPARITPLPRPPVTVPDDIVRSTIYGTDDPLVISALDDARTAAASGVDDTATRVAADAKSAFSIEQCAGDGLKNAGEGYRDRVREAASALEEVPAPDFSEVGDLVAGCLQSTFEVPAEAAFDLAKELADTQAQQALEALAASGSAAILAEWMVASGDTIAQGSAEEETVPVPEPEPEPVPDDDGTPTETESSGDPPWGLILGIAATAGVVAAVYFGGRSRRG